MLFPTNFPFCSEFYVVAKTIEVVVRLNGQDEKIRIEALHAPANSQIPYSTRSYIEKEITVQPTYPQDENGFSNPPTNMCIWVSFNLPWTNRPSADEALQQALGFLGEGLAADTRADCDDGLGADGQIGQSDT